MYFSDFRCPHCGYIKRWWDGIRYSFRCPVFQCIYDNGWDVLGPKNEISRIGPPMEYLGTFKDTIHQNTAEMVIKPDGTCRL